MLAQFIALFGAVTFAANHILVKKGLLAGATPTVCTLVNITSNAVCLWILVLFLTPLGALAAPQSLLFILVGILVPGLARILFFTGMDRCGVSRATAVIGAAPLFSTIVAMVALGERPDLPTALGTLCVVGGLVGLSLERHERITWKRTDLLFPLASALLFSARDNLTRFATRSWAYPLLGSAIATGAATFFVFLVNAPLAPAGSLRCNRTSFLFFALSGITSAVGYLCFYSALSMAPVVRVAPLLYTINIFSVILSYLFLKDSELLTLRVILSTPVIFTGILLVTAF